MYCHHSRVSFAYGSCFGSSWEMLCACCMPSQPIEAGTRWRRTKHSIKHFIGLCNTSRAQSTVITRHRLMQVGLPRSSFSAWHGKQMTPHPGASQTDL